MSQPMPDARRFTHEAMNTTFELRLRVADEGLAASLARECIEEIDRLEDRLSRFREDSEVTRINRMREGETLRLSEETAACLRRALEIHRQSGGLFDVTLGRQIEQRKAGGAGALAPARGGFMIDPGQPLITCLAEGREIDLGGIGKGFALDRLREILVDWEIAGGLLSAGASTQLAFGDAAWPVELRAEGACQRLELRDAALSASGTSIQGAHIVHPAGPKQPMWPRLWLVARDATLADAWSTAAILMPRDQLSAALRDTPGLSAILVEEEGAPVALDPS